MKKLALAIGFALAALLVALLLREGVRDGHGVPAIHKTSSAATGAADQFADLSGRVDAALPTPASGRRLSDDGPRVCGRLALPAGTPADATLVVHAYASKHDLRGARDFPSENATASEIADYLDRGGARPLATAAVSANGTFSFAVADLGEVAWLVVDGRYLRSRVPVELRATATEPGVEFVLHPILGGAIIGCLVAPTPDDLRGGVVALADLSSIARDQGLLPGQPERLSAWRCDARGRFELRGLARGEWDIGGASHTTALTRQRGIRIAPGKLVEVELILTAGATIRGSVTGDGEPLEGVSVVARPARRGWDTRDAWGFLNAHSRSGPDGSFELRHVSLRAPGISASLSRTTAEVKIGGPFASGEVVEGVNLRFDDVLSFSGRVVDAEGSGVGAAHVSLSTRFRDRWFPDSVDCTADAQGVFRMYASEAKGEVERRIDADLSDASGVIVARGFVSGMVLDAESVDIVMAPTRTVAGMVSSNTGRALRSALVSFSHHNDVPWAASARTDTAGSYAIAGIPAGTWKTRARADGWSPASALVDVPLEGEVQPLDFVLEPADASGIRGLVVTPDGVPIAGALVASATEYPIHFMELDYPIAVTDSSGHFMARRDRRATAWTPGYAPSKTQDAPGDGSEMVLELRDGGAVRGLVRTKEGEVAFDYGVFLQHIDESFMRTSMVDDSGRFEVADLAAGRWIARASPVPGTGRHGEDPAPAVITAWTPSHSVSAQFTVIAGETADVQLGRDMARSIHVVGELTAGGQPLERQLLFVPGDVMLSAQRLVTSSDAGGRFSIDLPAPGVYTAMIAPTTKGRPQFQFVQIPDRSECNVAIRLPSGGVRVAVLGIDREPVADAGLILCRGDGDGVGASLMGLLKVDEQATQADGSALFESLEPGTYTVALASPLGQRVEVEVTDDVVDITLEQVAPGAVRLMVNDEGSPWQGTMCVFVRDETGEWAPLSGRSHFGARSVALEIAPGSYSFFACSHDLATEESEPVRVSAGQAVEVNLTLASGTGVVVQVEGEGEPGELRVRVWDTAGRSWTGVLASPDATGQSGANIFSLNGLRPDTVLLGPLPAGTYRADIEWSGKRGSVSFALDGSLEQLDVTVGL